MIETQQIDDNLRLAVLAVAVLAIAATGAIVVNQLSPGLAVATVAAIIIFTFSFISTEIALYMLIFAMLLGPQLAISHESVAQVRGRGGITIRVDDFIIAIIGIAWFLKVAINKELGLLLSTPLNRPIALYTFICVLATIYGYYSIKRLNPTAAFFYVLKFFEYFLIYFMAVNHLKKPEQMKRLVVAMLWVCFLVCLYGIWQIPSGERVTAPFEGDDPEPNTLGGYLVLMLAVVISILTTPRSTRHKSALFFLLFLILLTLGATHSRGSWVALPPMLLTLIYLSRHRLTIIIPLLIFIILSPFVVPKSVVDRAAYTFNQPDNDEQLKIGNVKVDSSTSARLISWKVILTQDFFRHPVIGWGVTGHSFVDAQIPKILIETGLAGLISFFILIGALFKYGLRAVRHSRDPFFQALSIGYMGGLVGLLVHSVGANTFVIVRIMEPFWFLTALIVMIPKFESGEFQKETTERLPAGQAI